MTISLSSSSFWKDISGKAGTLQRDGALRYVVLSHSATMKIIRRTREELFSTTVNREGAGMTVVVNGNYYDVSTAGKMDALAGSDPVAASATTIEGRLISNGALLAGRAAPQMFYFAQQAMPFVGKIGSTYTTGFGDPQPGSGLVSAIGGLGPLIVGGLNYGIGNTYGKGAPAGAPATGAPGAAAKPHLTQRNNNTFKASETLNAATGKTILASCTARQKLLVGVQEHGATPGIKHSQLRDRLAALGFDHAVFLDGSDSSMMMHKGTWVVRAASNKDETNVVGVGFS
jgi:hypothetical protein